MGEEIKSLFMVLMLFAPLLMFAFGRWMWLHPHINKRKRKHNLYEAKICQERLDAIEDLKIDLSLKTMEKYNIRSKGIEIKWSGSINGQEKSLTFFADGKTETTKALLALATTVERETEMRLMKSIYKLPKRRRSDAYETVIHLNGSGGE